MSGKCTPHIALGYVGTLGYPSLSTCGTLTGSWTAQRALSRKSKRAAKVAATQEAVSDVTLASCELPPTCLRVMINVIQRHFADTQPSHRNVTVSDSCRHGFFPLLKFQPLNPAS